MKVKTGFTTRATAVAAGSLRQPKRLTLPIAPRANSRIRFATITGQTMGAMSVDEAVTHVARFIEDGDIPTAVDIAGPGEPLATPDDTIDCLRRLHQRYPELNLGIHTNGLGSAQMTKTLVSSGLKRITVAVDAVSTATAEKIYAWIRPGLRTVLLSQAVITLLNEQAMAIAAFSRSQIPVGIVTTVYPGFNDDEIEEIAMKMAALGASSITLVPHCPTPGDTESLDAPRQEVMELAIAAAGKHLPVVSDCHEGAGSCRPSDTVPPPAFSLPKASVARPNIAVVSHSGMEIDQHLGQASRLLIYGPREDGLVCLLETRATPASGTGVGRWQELAAIVPDCFALLTASAGENPREVLGRHGINVLITDGDIEGTVDVLYGGGKKSKKSC